MRLNRISTVEALSPISTDAACCSLQSPERLTALWRRSVGASVRPCGAGAKKAPGGAGAGGSGRGRNAS